MRRYEAVHRANLGSTLEENDVKLLDTIEDYSVYHIGCLIGELVSKLSTKVGGCEAYPMAKRYSRKRYGVIVTENSSGVKDNEYEVVVVDPTYNTESHEELLMEAARIASVMVVCGTVHAGLLLKAFPNAKQTQLNSKYTAVRVNNEDSDSSEE